MKTRLLLYIIFISLFAIACGGGNGNSGSADSASGNEDNGITEFELEHGIGPVTERLELGEINEQLVTRGRDIFEMKCKNCHNMQGRMVGPELGNVLDRRSPEFVMNMILNPGEMANDHPAGQEMLQEYMTVMPFQNVSREDAKAIVEFLRDYINSN